MILRYVGMSDRPKWSGTPTRLTDGEWGVLIQHVPATFPPRPGETVEVQTRRSGHWTARITAIEETSRQTVVRTTGPAEPRGHNDLHKAEPLPELEAFADDNPLGILREMAGTLHGVASALREAQRNGEQAHLEVLSALYYPADEGDLVEAHQVLRFSLFNRNASYHALEGAAQVLESATDNLFGSKDLLEQICWLNDLGEAKAASGLRTAIARMDAAGLLEAAGDALHEATVLLAAPANPNRAHLHQEHREELATLRAICAALQRAIRTARQDPG